MGREVEVGGTGREDLGTSATRNLPPFINFCHVNNTVLVLPGYDQVIQFVS